MEIAHIWHEHIKSKTLDEVIGYAFNVQKLVNEIKDKNAQGDLSDQELHDGCDYFIKLANSILGSVERNKTLHLKPHEMRELLSYMSCDHNAVYFTDKEAKRFNESLRVHPNAINFALLKRHFILNRGNIESLYDLMGNRFDKDATHLSSIQQLFCELRDELNEGDYSYFFDEQGQPQSDELLEDWFNYIFSTDYSGKMPVTHDQLWQFIRVADKQTTLRIFKKADILETDDIDFNVINWHDFFQAVASHNRKTPKHPILFDLHSYQNRRIILNLPFEQALDYNNMFINKLAGATEKAFSTGSKAMIALGQATKTMQLLSVFADILLKAAVFIKSFLIAPFFFVVLLLAGGKGHIDKRNEEQNQHKQFLLNAVRINELTKRVAHLSSELCEINQQHYNGTVDIIKELTANFNQRELVNKIPSQFRSELNKPLKARINSKFRQFKINLTKLKNILAPFLGPGVAGVLTAAGIFIVGLFFWHNLVFLISLGTIAAACGVGIVFFRVKTDRHEKNVRDILERSTARISDLTYYLNQQIQLKTKLLARVGHRNTLPAIQPLNIITISDTQQEQPFHIQVRNRTGTPQNIKQENATLRQQVIQLTRERDRLLLQVNKQVASPATEPEVSELNSSEVVLSVF